MSEEKKKNYKSVYGKSKSILTPELSKKVGFQRRNVDWPKNMEEIDSASDEQIVIWHRFLCGSRTSTQAKLLSRIGERLMGKK